MNFLSRMLLALALLSAHWAVHAAGRDIAPTTDTQVMETLQPRVRTSAATPQAAASAARQAINLARQSADPRYLGRAQAVLAPWWDKGDAPVELAVLQATVQQSRHEFPAAKVTLDKALQRDPSHAQGWLTLATLERVAGRYPQALLACAQVARAGAALYAAACQLETQSLQGQHDVARRGLETLRQQTTDKTVQAWLLSLLAESEERAGRDGAALLAYQTSTALAPDGYTTLAHADLLLRTAHTDAAQKALQLLSNQPDSDAVLLRRAYAFKLMNDPRWQALASDLRERFAALDARGDNPAAHARERAMAYLWLDGDAARALQSAKLNLSLQKEPLDWWLALQSAQVADQPAELTLLRNALEATGLRDARLQRWQVEKKP
jgi:predicted Zn-dependent protease